MVDSVAAPGQGQRTSLANLLLATRPDLTTEGIFFTHRLIDVVLGLLLVTNYLRSTGIGIGDDGTVSFSIAGPILTKPYLEAILYGIAPPDAPTVAD